MVIAAGTGSSRAIAGVARQIDKLQYRAVRTMKIGAWAVEYAALPVLLEGDLDAMSAQMLKCSRVLVVCNREGMMHTAMVVGHGVDRRVTLDQDEAGSSRVEEHHLLVRRGGQMPTADDLRVKPRTLRDISDGDAEMGATLDRNRVCLLSPLELCS